MTIHAVGLLSPGDMGHAVGQLLVNSGMPVLTCLNGRSKRTAELAKKANIKDTPTYEDLVQKTDMMLSILTPSEAVNAARKIAEALRNVNKTTVYVDCNAISPATSKKINEMMNSVGTKYVDASIIGPPPRQRGTTRFYTSGPHVESFMELANFGLDIRHIGNEIGQGKGIKMTYGALTKGLTAISTELLVAAWRMDLYNALIEELKFSQAQQLRRMESEIPRMPHRSRRWVGEMEEISKTFNELGMTPNMYVGASDIYRFVGEGTLAEETAETFDRIRTLAEVIEMLAKQLGNAQR